MPTANNPAPRIDALRSSGPTGQTVAIALDELDNAMANVEESTVDIERLRLSTRVNAKCEQLRNIADLFRAAAADLIAETLDEMEALAVANERDDIAAEREDRSALAGIMGDQLAALRRVGAL